MEAIERLRNQNFEKTAEMYAQDLRSGQIDADTEDARRSFVDNTAASDGFGIAPAWRPTVLEMIASHLGPA